MDESLLEDFQNFVSEEDKLEYYKKEIQRLEKANLKARILNEDKLDIVKRLFKEHIDTTSIPSISFTKDDRDITEEWAVVTLSDWQMGKTTADYDSSVCQERVRYFCEQVLKEVKARRKVYKINKVSVRILGDMLEGCTIFPGQNWLIDSDTNKQITNCIKLLVEVFKFMLKNFEYVQVDCVQGNHGRKGNKGSAEVMPNDNNDALIYSIVEMFFEGKERIAFNTSSKKTSSNDLDWYNTSKLGSHTTLLMHGEYIAGGGGGGDAGFPYGSVNKRILKLCQLPAFPQFDSVEMGHYHQAIHYPINRIDLYVCGSTESHNEYAIRVLASATRPSQCLKFINEQTGVTSVHNIWLD